MRSWLGVLLWMGLAFGQEKPGWRFLATPGSAYRGSLESTQAYRGQRCASIQSLPPAFARSYGLYWQALDASSYRGYRIRLEGFVRTRAVTGWAGLWVRVDPKEGPPLSFDNMQDRPIQGDTEWKPYRIEVDVPMEAEEIHLGGLLMGPGQIWLDELHLVRQGRFLPGAEEWRRARNLPKEPLDMDFESRE